MLLGVLRICRTTCDPPLPFGDAGEVLVLGGRKTLFSRLSGHIRVCAPVPPFFPPTSSVGVGSFTVFSVCSSNPDRLSTNSQQFRVSFRVLFSIFALFPERGVPIVLLSIRITSPFEDGLVFVTFSSIPSTFMDEISANLFLGSGIVPPLLKTPSVLLLLN